MQPLNLELPEKRTSDHKTVRKLSRRAFIKVAALASGSLGLWLSGCSPGGGQDSSGEGPLTVVEEWIRALDAEDVDAFEKLHTESVSATSHYNRNHVSGQEHVWELYQKSTGNQIEKITAFSQDQSACLLVNATKFNRSLCYVFNFVDGVIARVYEYESGRYDLASSAHFSGIEIVPDNTGLQERLNAMDNIFVDGLNNRDFSLNDKLVAESVITFVPTSAEPLIGIEGFFKDGEDYANFFPSVTHKKIQTFGQGNLVCNHVMVDGAPKGSLCFIGVFQGSTLAELYEFWSDARLEG